MSEINTIMIHRVYGLLPRSESRVMLFDSTDINEARKYARKHGKYFPAMYVEYGMKSKGEFTSEEFINNEFVDRCRAYPPDAKIGRIKRKSRFHHRIIYENDKKVCFLIRYKMNEARICIIDQEDKEKVMSLIKTIVDCYRIKIHRGAFPLVYFRHSARRHVTLHEIIFNEKRKGYVTFKDGNPYNYMKSNVIFSNVALTRNRVKPKSGYYGVTYIPNEKGNNKYVVCLRLFNKERKVGRYPDPITAAKAYDRARMEVLGRSAAKNFSYEYYAAFEPIYIMNVK